VFLTLVAGRLAFEIGADGFEVVHKGDSILLEPFVSWAWRNPGRTKARAIYVEELGPEAWR